MGRFKEKCELLELTRTEIENLNKPVASKGIES